MTLHTFFSGGDVDRQSWLRSDEQQLEQKLQADNTRFLVIWQSRCLVDDAGPLRLRRSEISHVFDLNAAIYLGMQADQNLFVIGLPDSLSEQDATIRPGAGFRALLGQMSEADAALLAYAKGMVEWRHRHQYCGLCGSRNSAVHGGSILQCTGADCGRRSFPRLDPAIIVLTLHGDLCLLGRQLSWPEGRFSTLAGFVEPGESLEDAVRREVHEEANIRIGACQYLGSQPWPFPGSLMVGFHAEATSQDIQLNDGELAEAHWFSRQTIAGGEISLPPPTSIAFRLIEHWFDRWDGDPLASLGVSSSFTSSAAKDTRK